MTSRPRRAMNESAALIARRTQAARDALRRRQKEKKARIVKKHVRYKQKQKLLSQLALSENEAPIVATEFARIGDEEEHHPTRKLARVNDGSQVEPSTPPAESGGDGRAPSAGSPENRLQVTAGGDDGANPKRVSKKYVPFAKERKLYEEAKKKRDEQHKEQEQKIKQREEMLKCSKKKRKQQAKQYRAVTNRGQPRMKHRIDALLARIEKQ